MFSKTSLSFIALHEGFQRFLRDLDKLEQFVNLNATAFSKVLKKWDKRSKSQTKEQYLTRAVDVQPVFSTSFPIRRLVWGDAENITYDQLESGYVCPIVSTEYAKIIPKLANLYETREAIE